MERVSIWSPVHLLIMFRGIAMQIPWVSALLGALATNQNAAPTREFSETIEDLGAHRNQ